MLNSWNIRYKGIYKEELQLSHGILPKGAVKFKEPDSLGKVFIQGFIVSVPIFFIIGLLAAIKWVQQYHSFEWMPFFLSAVAAMICTVVHEFLHSICYPKKAVKELWISPTELAAFIYCHAPVSKRRFILIGLCPNIVLGVIPYLVWISGIFDFNKQLSMFMICFSAQMIITGLGDYLNVYNALRQVPKGAVIQNEGIHSYWYLKNDIEDKFI